MCVVRATSSRFHFVFHTMRLQSVIAVDCVAHESRGNFNLRKINLIGICETKKIMWNFVEKM